MGSRRKGHFLGRGVEVPMSSCLGCGRQVNGASGVDFRGLPRPGNITVCLYCGHIMAFTEDLRLRELTDEEMIDVAGDPRLIAVQRARKLAKMMKQ
ncbi:hypothetical protein [Bradyrhizobium sp. 170]|uniref:hypothetical protein n=1 Tax=Bradyrhizobium sp. 170 TaxID=2782641 RepID=UPI001FFECEFE|nr:hypothetical protein [Bradyrhizobium sp. 170]UPK03157.1 hypothetical protein IVB05_37380 [Bradyrhizobium sp. 170]